MRHVFTQLLGEHPLLGHLGKLSPVLLAGLLIVACSSQVNLRISGTCKGPSGKPIAGMRVSHMEFGRPVGATLPPIYEKASVTSDANGRFVLMIRGDAPWLLQVDEPSSDAFVGGTARIKVPDELLRRGEIKVSLVVEGGRILNMWEK